MEIKKAPSADLERGKGLSLLLGLVVALSFLFTALEWHSYATVEKIDRALNAQDLEDVIAVEDEQQEEQKEPEQVQQEQTQPEVSLPDEFKVVDNSQEVAKMNFQASDTNEKPAPPPAPVGLATTAAPEETEEIFVVVEEPTEFPGGNDALNKYLSKSIRYPEIAQENGIQGRVIVQFVVEKDGSTAHIEVARGVDPALDKEAVRVVKEMPKWKPGKQRGKPVRTKYTLPVVFRLQ